MRGLFGLRWSSGQNRLPLYLSNAISLPVLWAVVLLLIATAGVVLGFGFGRTGDHGGIWHGDPNFYNILWQSILQALAILCSMVPVLHNGAPDWTKISDITFYGCVSISFVTAILTPIAYAQFPHPITSSTILNFAATVFSIIPATQLAGRFDRLANGKA